MFDIVIRNGRVIDGTGSPPYRAEVALRDGKIVKIAGKIEGEAKQVIDATGKVITPGFIDSHSHSDLKFYERLEQIEKVEQGITTSVCGQCGGSFCAANTKEFLSKNRGVALGANMALLIGHGTIRRAVMGEEGREPSAQELEQMKDMMRSAMESGALGVSFGLIYAPGCFAKTDELIEIAKVVAEYHGVASIHLRSEGEYLVRSVAEFITIVRKSGVRGVISHHKAVGLGENWGKVQNTLRMIDAANEEGLELYADVYPYIASSTRFSSAFLPTSFRSGGTEELLARLEKEENVAAIREDYYNKYPDMEWIMVSRCPGYPEYVGLRMPEIAKLRGQDEFSAALDLVRLAKDDITGCFFSMCEEDLKSVISHPRVMIGTDGAVAAGSTSTYHPRMRGTFPRALGRYVREEKTVSLPEMIRKMTSMPAAVYGFKTKGLVWEGLDADLCIFDPETIVDRADFVNCHLRAEGLSYVIVGGKIAAVDATATGELGGTILYGER